MCTAPYCTVPLALYYTIYYQQNQQTNKPTRSSKNTNIIKYVVPKCKTITYQKSFFIRSIRIWNTLADELDLSMENLSNFKSAMLNYYFSSLESTFNCENPRTFKTVCLKCNCSRSLTNPLVCCF